MPKQPSDHSLFADRQTFTHSQALTRRERPLAAAWLSRQRLDRCSPGSSPFCPWLPPSGAAARQQFAAELPRSSSASSAPRRLSQTGSRAHRLVRRQADCESFEAFPAPHLWPKACFPVSLSNYMEPLTQKEGENVTADTKVPSILKAVAQRRRDCGIGVWVASSSFSRILSSSGNEHAKEHHSRYAPGIDKGNQGTQMRGRKSLTLFFPAGSVTFR